MGGTNLSKEAQVIFYLLLFGLGMEQKKKREKKKMWKEDPRVAED
jgi:hypothetical protein